MGEMSLHVHGHSKEAPTRVTLKDVPWIPGLPCRLLSTGTVRRRGGELADSGTKKSCLRFKKDGPKIPLAETKTVKTRTMEWQLCGIAAYIFRKTTKNRVTLKERRDIFRHIYPNATKYTNANHNLSLTKDVVDV